MDITIHSTFLPHDDRTRPWPSTATPSASRSAQTTSATTGCRWITVGPPPARHIHRPAPTGRRPGITDDERRTITEMMARALRHHHPGHHRPRRHLRTTPAGDAESSRSRTKQPYGVRDCASAIGGQPHPHQRTELSRPILAVTRRRWFPLACPTCPTTRPSFALP